MIYLNNDGSILSDNEAVFYIPPWHCEHSGEVSCSMQAKAPEEGIDRRFQGRMIIFFVNVFKDVIDGGNFWFFEFCSEEKVLV